MVNVTSVDVVGGRGRSTAGGVGAAVGLFVTDIGVRVEVTGAGGADDAGGGEGGSGGVLVNSDLLVRGIISIYSTLLSGLNSLRPLKKSNLEDIL